MNPTLGLSATVLLGAVATSLLVDPLAAQRQHRTNPTFAQIHTFGSINGDLPPDTSNWPHPAAPDNNPFPRSTAISAGPRRSRPNDRSCRHGRRIRRGSSKGRALGSFILLGRSKELAFVAYAFERAPCLVTVLGPGECFGEMAYLSLERRERGATVSTAKDSHVVRIRIADLEKATVACRSNVDRAFIGILVERLNLANTRLTSG